MCTSITVSSPLCLHGRNLDLEYSFGEQVVITPRGYEFKFHRRAPIPRHFAMVGMANVANEYPLYAEAANEKGLYMAGLNFPGNAWYPPQEEVTGDAVTPYELIPLVLGQCETLAQAKALLESVQLVGIPFAPGYPLAPLHWHIADATGALVAEPMRDGLHLYEDPVGVLTNNPPFPYQLTVLNNYQHLSPKPAENRFAAELPLAPYGQGMGAIGLPGDFSPQSRYVKSCFLKANAVWGDTPASAVAQFFHILDGVAMVRGSVRTPEDKCDITTYSCCIDAAHGIYYFKTYDNNRIRAVHLHAEDLETGGLFTFPLEDRQDVEHLNGRIPETR